jgi:hypothetical protein
MRVIGRRINCLTAEEAGSVRQTLPKIPKTDAGHGFADPEALTGFKTTRLGNFQGSQARLCLTTANFSSDTLLPFSTRQ